MAIDNGVVLINNRLFGLDNQLIVIRDLLIPAANTRIILKNNETKVIDTYQALYKAVCVPVDFILFIYF